MCGICRYQSIRRTITSRRLDCEDSISGSGSCVQGQSQAMSSDGSGSSSGGEQQRLQQPADTVHHMPAVRFISRPDFFSILHMNQVFVFSVEAAHRRMLFFSEMLPYFHVILVCCPSLRVIFVVLTAVAVECTVL